MKIGRAMAAIPILTIGLLLWRHAQWVVGPDNSSQDGTCAGIEELVSQCLAVAFATVALLVLAFGTSPVRRLVQIVVGPDEACAQRPATKSESEESRDSLPFPSDHSSDFFE